MNKILSSLTKLIIAILLLWVFPHFSVAVSAPDQVILELVNADSPDPVVAGNLLTYTLSVTNTGEESASGVVLSDVLPAGVTFNEASPGCNPVAGVVSCELGSLDPNSLIVVTITVEVDPAARGSLTNVASVTSNETGPGEPINEVTTINAIAALTISKDDGVSQVTAGDGVARTYAIQVTNAGPSDASGVAVTDTWPAGFNRGTVNYPPGLTCDTTTSPRDFTCDLGDIPVGGQRTITVDYTVPPDTEAGFQTNTAQADSVDASATATAHDTNTVVRSANLAINKSDGASQVIAGVGVVRSYTIRVTNSGPSDASNVLVTDTWPVGFTRVSVSPSAGGTCDTTTSPSNFTCTFTSIPADGSKTITANYTVPSGTPEGSQTNAVQASSADASVTVEDSDINNVTTQADLSLSMLDSPDPVISNGIITYTINVMNNGPSNALGVVLTDTLPPGATFQASHSSIECTGGTGSVTCNLGNIISGTNRQVHINVRKSSLTTVTVINQAEVTSAITSDPTLANNQTEVSTTVDSTIPELIWTKPVPTQETYEVGCQHIGLEVEATDNDLIQRVIFKRWVPVDSSGYYTEIGTDYSYPYTWNFDACVLQPEYNHIFAQAFDRAGNASFFPGHYILLFRWNYIYLPVVSR